MERDTGGAEMTMIGYIARWLPAALRHPLVALKGFQEGRGDLGLTFDNDPCAPRSVAYDVGRTVRRRDA